MYVALAKRQRHAHSWCIGNGDALARRVQANDVAHHHFGAKLASTPGRHVTERIFRPAHTDQRGTHFGQRFTRRIERYVEVSQHHVQGGFSVQRCHDIAFTSGDFVGARDRLAALGNPRHQSHTAGQVAGESHATQAASEDATRRALAVDIAVTAQCKLHSFTATGGQAAKHITAFRTFSHFADQLGDIWSARVSMDQRRVGVKTAAGRRRQRCDARKHTVLVMRQLAQHCTQRGLIKILHVVRCDAHAYRAAPVGHLGQLGT